MFRRFEIVRNSDNNISIFALDVDVAANPDPLEDGSPSPALTSRSYAIAAQQIFQYPVKQGPHVNSRSGVYNAELVKQLSPEMQQARQNDQLSGFQNQRRDGSTTSPTVTLNNTVVGSTPTHYMASESSTFKGAIWRPYSKAPSFTLSSTPGVKTVYFKVKDGSRRESVAAKDNIRMGASPVLAHVSPGH
jgi:hypothetical protein